MNKLFSFTLCGLENPFGDNYLHVLENICTAFVVTAMSIYFFLDPRKTLMRFLYLILLAQWMFDLGVSARRKYDLSVAVYDTLTDKSTHGQWKWINKEFTKITWRESHLLCLDAVSLWNYLDETTTYSYKTQRWTYTACTNTNYS